MKFYRKRKRSKSSPVFGFWLPSTIPSQISHWQLLESATSHVCGLPQDPKPWNVPYSHQKAHSSLLILDRSINVINLWSKRQFFTPLVWWYLGNFDNYHHLFQVTTIINSDNSRSKKGTWKISVPHSNIILQHLRIFLSCTVALRTMIKQKQSCTVPDGSFQTETQTINDTLLYTTTWWNKYKVLSSCYTQLLKLRLFLPPDINMMWELLRKEVNKMFHRL